MAVSMLITTLMAANALWFGAGFFQFMLRSRGAASWLMANTSRDAAHLAVLAGSVRFLGGLNLGFSALSVMILLHLAKFADPVVTAVLLGAFAIAHGSQFMVNVPIARAERSGIKSLWPVLKGPMLMIFVIDALLAVLNLAFFIERLWS